MSFYDAYKARLSVIPSTTTNYFREHTKRVINDSFQNSPSYCQVLVNDLTELVEVQIVDDSKEKELKMMLSPSYHLRAGDLIKWKDEYWLTTIVDNMGEVYFRGAIKRCESSLKWLNSSGESKEAPFTLKISPAAAYGAEQDKVMILSRERRTVIVQANADTKKITKAQRFIFDERAWEVVGLNGLTDGLIEISLEEDQTDRVADNLELRIADYHGKAANYNVKILNGQDNSLSLDDFIQLNVVVTNKGSQVNSPLLAFSSSDDSIATVDETGLIIPRSKGEVTVTVSYRGAQSKISINVTERRAYNFTLDIEGSSEIKVGQKQKYHVTFYNNGNVISDRATFTLSTWDGFSTSLAKLSAFEDNSCEIEAGKIAGKVILNATNKNGLIIGSKEIKIKSLI